MRKIELRSQSFHDPEDGAEHSWNYARQIRIMVGKCQPHQGQGVNYSEIRLRVRLLDALDAARNDVLLIEEHDHALLSEIAKSWRWGVADQVVLDFTEAILKAPQVTVQEAETFRALPPPEAEDEFQKYSGYTPLNIQHETAAE